jgi:hypothetical protein
VDPEAIGPLPGISERRSSLLSDNVNGFETGVAIVNPNPSAPLTVAATLRDESGRTLATQTLTLAAMGHTTMVVSQAFPASANRRGSILLSASPSGVAALGLRFSPSGVFTSFPALTSADIQP